MSTISRRAYALAIIALAAIIFVTLNIALDASVTTARLDLTENGVFTLSKGTKSTIAKLQEPITLKFFYSKKVASDYAQIQAYANRVRDLLHNYAAISGGNITFSWNAILNVPYVVQSTTNLKGSNWTYLGSSILATNNVMSISIPIGNAPAAFYRVALSPQ